MGTAGRFGPPCAAEPDRPSSAELLLHHRDLTLHQSTGGPAGPRAHPRAPGPAGPSASTVRAETVTDADAADADVLRSNHTEAGTDRMPPVDAGRVVR